MAKRTTRGWFEGDPNNPDPDETSYGSLVDYLGYLSDLGEGKVGWGHSKTPDPTKAKDNNEDKSDLGGGKGGGKDDKGSTGVDPEDELKHGGRIKKKKRKKKGRPRGVGKALHGYGKAMKHGK